MILTYKYRIKDRNSRKVLRRHAHAVNQVWNYCVAHQREVQSRYRSGGINRGWTTHYELQRLTSGTSKELGIHSNTIGSVCEQFVKNRTQTRKCPNFRASSGPRRALGWIPFRKDSRRIDDNSIIHAYPVDSQAL